MDLDAGSVMSIFCVTHFCTSVVPQLLLINSNESVVFECFRPSNGQNPSDVYFNEVQFGVSFVLEMEYKVYFSVKIENFVWRTVFSGQESRRFTGLRSSQLRRRLYTDIFM